MGIVLFICVIKLACIKHDMKHCNINFSLFLKGSKTAQLIYSHFSAGSSSEILRGVKKQENMFHQLHYQRNPNYNYNFSDNNTMPIYYLTSRTIIKLCSSFHETHIKTNQLLACFVFSSDFSFSWHPCC